MAQIFNCIIFWHGCQIKSFSGMPCCTHVSIWKANWLFGSTKCKLLPLEQHTAEPQLKLLRSTVWQVHMWAFGKHWLFWKDQVLAAAIGATYRWTTIEAFEKHCVLSTHVSIWKALAVLEAPRASCCHWSNIQLNQNWSFWEALCAKSIWKQNGKMFQWKHYVLNACTCLCTWINDWLCNMENMFLGKKVAVARNFFLLECCAAKWCCQDNHKKTKPKTQRNNQRLNELSWLRS